jgi:hypothetical protein
VPAVEGIIAVVPFHEAVLVGDVVGVEVKRAPVSGRPVPFRMDLYQPPDAPRAPVPVLKPQLSPSRAVTGRPAEDYQ